MRLGALSYVAVLALCCDTFAQSTAFTYQGRLKNGSALVSGVHDFRFTLFNVASGGVQVVPPVCVDNVPVAEGLFTTTIDFGQQFATTEGRFLQIEVRADTGLSCTDSTGLIVLGPRQPLTAAPMATHAKTAFSLSAADGSPASAVSVDDAGNVGIGTGAPTHTVHIASLAPTLALQDTDSQQSGYVSYRNSANSETAWVGYGSSGDPDFSVVNARAGGDIVLLPIGGNVGIGTAAPSAKLDVRGNIRFGSSGQFSTAAGVEDLRLVRGNIDGTGALLNGSGFTSQRINVGFYQITFTPAFSGTPTVTITASRPANAQKRWAHIREGTLASSGVFIDILDDSAGGFTNSQFSFCAIGPR